MNEIKSPCINICKIEIINNEKTCVGCYRTLEQIRDWGLYSDAERDKIIEELKPNECRGNIYK